MLCYVMLCYVMLWMYLCMHVCVFMVDLLRRCCEIIPVCKLGGHARSFIHSSSCYRTTFSGSSNEEARGRMFCSVSTVNVILLAFQCDTDKIHWTARHNLTIIAEKSFGMFEYVVWWRTTFTTVGDMEVVWRYGGNWRHGGGVGNMELWCWSSTIDR